LFDEHIFRVNATLERIVTVQFVISIWINVVAALLVQGSAWPMLVRKLV
jgi:hypothetical protein